MPKLKDGQDRRDERITISLAPHVLGELEADAAQRGISVGELVRLILSEWFCLSVTRSSNRV